MLVQVKALEGVDEHRSNFAAPSLRKLLNALMLEP